MKLLRQLSKPTLRFGYPFPPDSYDLLNCLQILGIENANINPLGGAISLGHALGSSGSRILTTLVHQLKVGEYGVAAVCNGGGAATAVVVQRVDAV